MWKDSVFHTLFSYSLRIPHLYGTVASSSTDRSADDIKYTLELSLDLFNSIGLDNVTYLDIIVALDIKTAIHSHQNLLDIILEPLERAEFACIYDDTVTDYADLRSSLKLTLTDDTSGNGTDL